MDGDADARKRGILIGLVVAAVLASGSYWLDVDPDSNLPPLRFNSVGGGSSANRTAAVVVASRRRSGSTSGGGEGARSRHTAVVERARLLFTSTCAQQIRRCAEAWAEGITTSARRSGDPNFDWAPVAKSCHARVPSRDTVNTRRGRLWSHQWWTHAYMSLRGDDVMHAVARDIAGEAFPEDVRRRSSGGSSSASMLPADSAFRRPPAFAGDRRNNRSTHAAAGALERGPATGEYSAFRLEYIPAATLDDLVSDASAHRSRCLAALEQHTTGSRSFKIRHAVVVMSVGIIEAEDAIITRQLSYIALRTELEGKVRKLLRFLWTNPCVGTVFVLEQSLDCRWLRASHSSPKSPLRDRARHCAELSTFVEELNALLHNQVAQRSHWFGHEDQAARAALIQSESGPATPAAFLADRSQLPADDLDFHDAERTQALHVPAFVLPALAWDRYRPPQQPAAAVASTVDGAAPAPPYAAVLNDVLRHLVWQLWECVAV